MKKAFRIGTISLVFCIIGFQTALLVSRASILYIEAKRDRPDTVYIFNTIVDSSYLSPSSLRERSSLSLQGSSSNSQQKPSVQEQVEIRRNSSHSEVVQQIRNQSRKVESFRFDPNTATLEQFVRLGFSEKQAASILNYRSKGGRFRRPSDFAKSFVVSDSVFKRLEPYIDIPKIDINKADSVQLTSLPGIGAYYAKKIIEYREKCGGFTSIEQIMDVNYIDIERFNSFSDLIICSKD